ncbi:spore germination protein [Paenibacillus nanensis]|uniref:Spore germination protein n=1 Tax=Paenibacillus nanensis TaxID=393251 RepID=A0A3A1V635_9BACL|nr:spore germination protein [Paenibacillus nanensis]RIX52970.1 spore germination protein [Paenibacillus nanensis]
MDNLEKDITDSLAENTNIISAILGDSADINKREFSFGQLKGVCFFAAGLANTDQVSTIVRSFAVFGEHQDASGNRTIQAISRSLILNTSVETKTKINDGIKGILSGDTLVLLDGYKEYLLVETKGWDKRGVEEPSTENVVRGPRDGFTEDIRTNTSHIRRRIKNPDLRFDEMTIGDKTNTSINIAYLNGTVKKGLVEEIKSRLSRIKIDGVLESGYIEELIQDAPLSPFSTIQSTERPDKVSAALLEGRAAILVDNTPFALIMPSYFWEQLQAPDDYYNNFWMGTFFRMLRYFAFLTSVLLPSAYVMLISFHQEMIPTRLAFTIASGREVVPFPVLFEALIMELAFELMREAGLRMPKPVGQAVSIVGSLIIGQSAVQAGLISPFMVIIIAITGISSFAIPSYSTSFSIRLLRFPMLIASGTMGLLGFTCAFFMVMIHVLSIRSFGEPFFSPIAPFSASEHKDILVRVPWWAMVKRPRTASGELRRLGAGQKPKPPSTSEERHEGE